MNFSQYLTRGAEMLCSYSGWLAHTWQCSRTSSHDCVVVNLGILISDFISLWVICSDLVTTKATDRAQYPGYQL